MKKATALLATILILTAALTSCMARTAGDGDLTIVGRWNNNGDIIEYRKNGELVRDGKIEYYSILPDNRMRVYTDRAAPNRGRIYPYSLQDGALTFDGSQYSPIR